MRETLPQSVGLVHFFATLGGGVVIVWVVQRLVGDQLTYIDNNATVSLVQDSNAWFQVLVENMPVLFLLIASMGGLAWTVYQTRYT
jgi:Na+-transporting methylmalonyl-CoA/oxaloacetate decarboxylase beta subunit